MPISLPYRLAHRYRLVAAEVAAVFAPIVTAINGLLKADAFAPWARVKNANKVAPNGLLALHFHTGLAVGPTRRMHVPLPGPGSCAEPVTLNIVRWSFQAKNDPAIAITGTVSLYRNDSSGAETLVTSRTIPVAEWFNDAVASAPAGDVDTRLSVEVTLTGGDTLNDVAATVWLEAAHVR
jgi:hypothetical protein